MEIQVEASEVINGGYFPLDGGEFICRKMPGRMVRCPPKRGAVKVQIFASIAVSLAEFLRILTKRAQMLSEQRIMMFARMYLGKADSNSSSSLVESMKKLLHLDAQNLEASAYSFMGSKLKSRR